MVFGLPVTDHRRTPVMTISHAHLVMQTHIDCPLTACPLKQQAREHLIEEHRLVPGDREFLGY